MFLSKFSEGSLNYPLFKGFQTFPGALERDGAWEYKGMSKAQPPLGFSVSIHGWDYFNHSFQVLHGILRRCQEVVLVMRTQNKKRLTGSWSLLGSSISSMPPWQLITWPLTLWGEKLAKSWAAYPIIPSSHGSRFTVLYWLVNTAFLIHPECRTYVSWGARGTRYTRPPLSLSPH